MFSMLSSNRLSILTLLSSLGLSHATTLPTSTGHPSNSTQRRGSASYAQAAYFPNWGIYAANFQPTDIEPSHLTHVLYAFADVAPGTGEVFLTDTWADEAKHFPGDSWNEPGNNLYGCLKQLYLLKLAHRHLKVLLSIGGWTYSQEGHFSFLTDSNLRGNFVTSVVQLIADYGLDGIDIDFEYPSNEAEGQGFLDLMTSIRHAFDDLATANGDATPYELTAAVTAGPQFYPVQQLDNVLTFWNLMAYDYAGPWLTTTGNQANLYGTGTNTDAAVNHYISSGATREKILMGIPLYGRVFENTNGIGQSYSGVGPGTREAGIYAYKDLPLPGATVFKDFEDVASYSYDPVKRELISYDVPDIVRIKAEYVRAGSLGGCMFWELSSDKAGQDSLVLTAGETLGQLDQTSNHIHYPNSKWDNIRNNMAESTVKSIVSTSTSSSTSPTETATTSQLGVPSPTSSSAPSCLCTNVSPWSPTTVYRGGNEAVYYGRLWTAKWWTENDMPGGTAGVWVDDGACD